MIYFDKENIDKKLAKFNKDNVYIVADFDLTMTAVGSEDSWSIFGKSGVLGKKFFDEATSIAQHYYKFEIDETLEFDKKFALMDEWWHKEFSLFVKYGLTETMLDRVVDKVQVVFRAGVKEFLCLMHKNGVPVIIISGGIGDIIERVLKKNDCNFDNIHRLANFIEFKNGVAVNTKGKMIHVLNKSEQALAPDVSKKLENRPNVLLFGDMVGDANMTSAHNENVIRVGFLNQKEDENLQPFKKAFDIVCTNNTSFTDLFKKTGMKFCGDFL